MSKVIKNAIGVICLLFIAGIFLGNRFFYSMDMLPEGRLLETYRSPDHLYQLNLYLVNSHSTVAPAIRGELVVLKSGKARNIYWDYRVEQAEIKWKLPNEVEINGHLISLPRGHYDFRHSD